MVYQWAVIGAGPAGIAAVGKLLDQKVSGDIVWIDPEFRVGDFGTIWRNVPSNTKVRLFLKFLNDVNAFSYANCPHTFEIDSADPDATCTLRLMAEPLEWVTAQLKNQVHTIQDTVAKIALHHGEWQISFSNQQISAKNVILAIGAKPKTFPDVTQSIIPLQDAMDNERIKSYVEHNDTVAVFGSSHSAMLVLRHLIENNVKHVINFYRSPLRYAVYFDDWILFDDSGLKGSTADWARHHIDGKLPTNLERVYASNKHIVHYLPLCQKVVYAIGFERREYPVIEHLNTVRYDEQTGIIAPGLFGLGIAFPEAKVNPLGQLEYRVGLWKFMDYLNRVLPIWLSYSTN